MSKTGYEDSTNAEHNNSTLPDFNADLQPDGILENILKRLEDLKQKLKLLKKPAGD